MNKPLSGMYAALLSGFADDGAFDEERQVAITKYVLRQNIDGIYIGGSSGESGLMSTDELLEQQDVIARLPQVRSTRIIAHVGQPNLRDSIALAKHAEQLGFNALSALPPHSYPFSDQDIFEYYAALAQQTNLPLIVYEVPLRTGRPLPVELLLKILDLPNVGGIKFTSTDLYKLSVLRRSRPEKTYFFGFDEIYAGAAMLGIDGGIGTTYNILGKLFMALNAHVTVSEVKEARELQEISQRFVELLEETGVIPGMKAALRVIGVNAGHSRPPMIEKITNSEERLAYFLGRPEVRQWLAEERENAA